MPGSKCETWRRVCDDLGSNILVFCWSKWRITAGDCLDMLGNHVHPVVKMLFPDSDEIFEGGDSPIHIARSVQSSFKEHEDTLRHRSWPAQSPDLNIVEVLFSLLDSREKHIPSSFISPATRRCSS